ncbi:glycerol kinase GlpK [Pseudoroseicyclus tamaricis]|uniref:glycerol kinase n=1 Tax=Pseudoroseicyclus tamaricis TaxID=2705421 RepID=A0A6B2JR80_9RHOB|nr:glycerol kinase GlpK [Pseudoroseicyclus tamaricis]NDV00678.1 glycerol kinase GlpK [Pseudoroseicyclus tamaricis]
MSILALDQGTTSSRAILFGDDMAPGRSHQLEFPQHFPRSGWVEHDPADIWRTTLESAGAALAGESAAAIGITNQRETVVVWDEDGRPIHNAIVWQDRRTAGLCRTLRAEGLEEEITARTGLIIDPYFSATKLAWLLEHVDGAREQAEAGKLRFGTVDSWLIWNLTEGRVHATDATNACRTMLYDIHKGAWDEDICARLGIPLSMLPDVRDSDGDFGETTLLGGTIPLRGVAGDQQAATLGQACFAPGMLKSTYGTGCFALLNTGGEAVTSEHRLLTTIAYRLAGQTTYALEGSIFIAGAVVQWLRDGLKIIDAAPDAQPLAETADEGHRLTLVPAFTGLGAPHWAPEARGAIFGLTRNSGPAEFARAALESVGFQTADLMSAMKADWPQMGETVLRVDGGMTASDWTMQFLSDILGAPVDRPQVQETTALGAAWLAGQAIGAWPGPEGFSDAWQLDRRFEPQMEEGARSKRLTEWRDAVARTIGG